MSSFIFDVREKKKNIISCFNQSVLWCTEEIGRCSSKLENNIKIINWVFFFARSKPTSVLGKGTFPWWNKVFFPKLNDTFYKFPENVEVALSFQGRGLFKVNLFKVIEPHNIIDSFHNRSTNPSSTMFFDITISEETIQLEEIVKSFYFHSLSL